MTSSAISNACDELHERLRAAADDRGMLLETEYAAIVHSVARHYGVSVWRLLMEADHG